MKRAYSKPDVFFEDFAMSTNIAAGCEEFPHGFADGCGVLWGHAIIFTDDMTGTCLSPTEEGAEEFNKLCYHNPDGGYNVFMS